MTLLERLQALSSAATAIKTRWPGISIELKKDSGGFEYFTGTVEPPYHRVNASDTVSVGRIEFRLFLLENGEWRCLNRPYEFPSPLDAITDELTRQVNNYQYMKDSVSTINRMLHH